MRCVLTDSFGLSISNGVLMFEIYVFQILHLLTKYLTHCLAVSFNNLDQLGPSTAPSDLLTFIQR